MNFQHQPSNNYMEMMYNQLVNQYIALSSNYHAQSETNLSLFRKVQQLLEEKLNLIKNASIQTSKTLPSSGLLPNRQQHRNQDLEGYQQLESRQNKKKKISKTKPKRIKSNQVHQDNKQDQYQMRFQIVQSLSNNEQKYRQQQHEILHQKQVTNDNMGKKLTKQKGGNRLITRTKQKRGMISEFENNDSQQ